MKKFSTSPFFFKKVFPAIWFGFLLFFIFIVISFWADIPSAMFLLAPIAMGVAGFFFFKTFLWDLADEVVDEGDRLIVKNGTDKQIVFLKDIVNVNLQFFSPERVVLTIRQKGHIDNQIAFIPPYRINKFSKNEFVVKLIKRVDDARNT